MYKYLYDNELIDDHPITIFASKLARNTLMLLEKDRRTKNMDMVIMNSFNMIDKIVELNSEISTAVNMNVLPSTAQSGCFNKEAKKHKIGFKLQVIEFDFQ